MWQDIPYIGPKRNLCKTKGLRWLSSSCLCPAFRSHHCLSWAAPPMWCFSGCPGSNSASLAVGGIPPPPPPPPWADCLAQGDIPLTTSGLSHWTQSPQVPGSAEGYLEDHDKSQPSDEKINSWSGENPKCASLAHFVSAWIWVSVEIVES